MANGDDYDSGQPDNTGDSDVQRKKSALELLLRASQKPSISPVMTQNQPSQGAASGGRTSVLGNQRSGLPEEETAGTHRTSMFNPAGNDAPSLLKRPNTQNQRATGATPTNAADPENPIAQPRYTPSSAPVRPNIPAPRATDTTAPDINANAPWTQSSGKRVLGMGSPLPGTQVLGLNRGAQPARPDVMPTRADFPEKPIPTWEKVLAIGAAPFVPGVSAALLTSPRRSAERQYEGAVKDWERGQQGAERQARIEETQARTRSLLNPPQKEGVTPEETTIHDLMTGGPNGGPKINPQTQKPYEYLEAYSAVQQAKTGAAQGAKQPPLDQDRISQINDMHTGRYQVLNPGKPLPPALTLRPGSTQADYDRIDKNLTSMESAQGTQAQRAFNQGQRLDAAAQRAQDRADKQAEKDAQPVYAYDPKSKQTILTTAGEARNSKLEATRKVSQPDIEKDTDKLRQIGDAQMNVSAYRASLQGMNALAGNDLARVGALIGDDKFKLHFMGLEIPVDWYNQLRDNQKFNDLPEDAKDAVVGYIGARGSIIAYTKAISGTGRLTETQLQTEMQNLPKPTDPPDVAEKKFARFQRNIDQAASGLPKIPGIDTPAEIRAKTEITKPQMPTPAQPQAAAPKPLKKRLVDYLNRKVGAE